VLCLTQNETSNGTQITNEILAQIRRLTDATIAIDVTSSLGGIMLDWTLGDVWFASVQKCLGLPAGMGIMVCSPNALRKALQVNDILRYNSLLFIHENFIKSQTHYTPNALGVYLLMRVMEQVKDIETIHAITQQRAQAWYAFLEQETHWQPLISNQVTRSDTVIAVQGTPEDIVSIKKAALVAGVTLGNGYGEWRNNTYRIANFPAIEDEEIATLKGIIRSS